MNILLRRRKLGRTSCREISRKSTQDVRVIRSDSRHMLEITPNDLVIRWGYTGNVSSPHVVNTARAIHQVNDKLEFRRTLNNEELCPQTWFTENDFGEGNYPWGYPIDNFIPVIVRPRQHAQGRNLHLCRTVEELIQICDAYGNGNYYISEFIDKVAEYRVFVVQGRVVCVAQKTPGNPEDIAWNVARGGRFDNVRWDEWPLKVCKIAIKAFNLSSLDFGGVDVMVDNDGAAYVLEINSAPSLTSEYRQACFARALDWLIVNGKDRITLIEEKGGYKKFIHPAICNQARLIGG